MERIEFIKMLFTSSKNSQSREKPTTPHEDNLKREITGIDVGVDQYDNYYIKSFWAGSKKAYYYHIPLNRYLLMNRYIVDNNIVTKIKEANDPFDKSTVGVEDTIVDEKKNTKNLLEEDQSEVLDGWDDL